MQRIVRWLKKNKYQLATVLLVIILLHFITTHWQEIKKMLLDR